MVVLFIVKVKVLMLVEMVIFVPRNMFIIEPRMNGYHVLIVQSNLF